MLALTQYMYHPDRITTPLKRVGARGEGKFEPISWDEAFDTCESKLKDIRAQHGAESVIFVQGTGRDIGGPISFLAYSYGSPNWVQLGLSGHSCYTPRLGAMKAAVGDFTVLDCSQFLEKRYEDPAYKYPKVIIVWAQGPVATCPDAFFGHWVIDCMKNGGSEIISVDPQYTWLTTRAKYHLPMRPGTDAALALGMMNVIINEGLYDKEFVEKWTFGFDKLKERVQQYPVQKVSEITWVPADLIVKAARLYATAKPAGIQWGVPVDMNPEGTVTAAAINHLWCLTGNIDVPGGNVIARPSHGVTTYPYTTEELVYLYGQEMVNKLNEKRIGADKYPMVKGFRGWAHPDETIDQVASGKPYPIKAAWIQTANVIGGQAARMKFHFDALKKLDFVVRRGSVPQPDHHGSGGYCAAGGYLPGEKQLPLLVGTVEHHQETGSGRRVQVGLGNQLGHGEAPESGDRQEVQQRNRTDRRAPGVCRSQLREAGKDRRLEDVSRGSVPALPPPRARSAAPGRQTRIQYSERQSRAVLDGL